MTPTVTKPDRGDPPRKPPLTRYAIWSAVVTLGVPLVWAVLTNSLGGDAGLAVGWFGVLPVILFVPVGVIATLVLSVAAAVQANAPDGGTPTPHSGSTHRSDGNA